jgi:hypothetical protein
MPSSQFPNRLRKNCVELAISALGCVVVSGLRAFLEDFSSVDAPRVRFRAVRRHYGPDSLRGNSSGHEVSHMLRVLT